MTFFCAVSGFSSERVCSSHPLLAVTVRELVGLIALISGLVCLRLLFLIQFGPLPAHLGRVDAAATVHNSGLVVVAVLNLNGPLREVDLFRLDRVLRLTEVFIAVREVAAVT